MKFFRQHPRITVVLLLVVVAVSLWAIWAGGRSETALWETSSWFGTTDYIGSSSDSDEASEEEESDTDEEAEEESSSGNQVYVNQLADSSFLYETSISDIANADSYYEGQTVQIQGEAVGDIINDDLLGSYCWVTLQDDDEKNPSVVSVYMSAEQAEVIDTLGSYGVVGTTLQVRGVVHLECSEHQGAADIHAEVVSALAAGSTEEASPVSKRVLLVGGLAVMAGLLLLLVYQVRYERQR